MDGQWIDRDHHAVSALNRLVKRGDLKTVREPELDRRKRYSQY